MAKSTDNSRKYVNIRRAPADCNSDMPDRSEQFYSFISFSGFPPAKSEKRRTGTEVQTSCLWESTAACVCTEPCLCSSVVSVAHHCAAEMREGWNHVNTVALIAALWKNQMFDSKRNIVQCCKPFYIKSFQNWQQITCRCLYLDSTGSKLGCSDSNKNHILLAFRKGAQGQRWIEIL